jgi:hypothetical protein
VIFWKVFSPSFLSFKLSRRGEANHRTWFRGKNEENQSISSENLDMFYANSLPPTPAFN